MNTDSAELLRKSQRFERQNNHHKREYNDEDSEENLSDVEQSKRIAVESPLLFRICRPLRWVGRRSWWAGWVVAAVLAAVLFRQPQYCMLPPSMVVSPAVTALDAAATHATQPLGSVALSPSSPISSLSTPARLDAYRVYSKIADESEATCLNSLLNYEATLIDPSLFPLTLQDYANNIGKFSKTKSNQLTDKFTDHRYDFMYNEGMLYDRCKPLVILEIGLGCGMGYGAGASAVLWYHYFVNAKIFILEHNMQCLTDWVNGDGKPFTDRVTVFQGDQSNEQQLNELLLKYHLRGVIDIIVDDGGHSHKMQQVSIRTLFPALRYGGTYYLEDLFSSYCTVGYLKRDFEYKNSYRTTSEGIQHWIDQLMRFEIYGRNLTSDEYLEWFMPEVKWIKCSMGICSFRKFEEHEMPRRSKHHLADTTFCIGHAEPFG